MDVLTTTIALRSGAGYEANPLMVGIADNVLVISGLKLLLVAMFAAYVIVMWKDKVVLWIFTVLAIGIYVIVVASNFGVLINA